MEKVRMTIGMKFGDGSVMTIDLSEVEQKILLHAIRKGSAVKELWIEREEDSLFWKLPLMEANDG